MRALQEWKRKDVRTENSLDLLTRWQVEGEVEYSVRMRNEVI